jgi:hypothetical protein
MEREESSRRMMPSDPPGPVPRVSPTRIFIPGTAGSVFSPRVTVASPDVVRTTPIVSAAAAVPATARRHRAPSRTTVVTVFLNLRPPRDSRCGTHLIYNLPPPWSVNDRMRGSVRFAWMDQREKAA